MKLKFFLLVFLLVFARGCDFYSTSLWFFQPGGSKGETNPLTSVLGFGWTGLVVSNVIIVGLIIYSFYYYTFRYKAKKLEIIPDALKDYVSQVYFNKKGQFYKIYYTVPNDKKILLAHSGYVLVRVLIFGSFLAVFHNLCQFYDVSFYNSFREIVKRPLYVIYGLILISFFYFQYTLFNGEYKALKEVKSER